MIYSKIGGLTARPYSAPPNPRAAKFASQGDANVKTDAQIEFLYYPLYEYVLKGETSLVYELIKRAFLWDHPFITYAKFSEKLSFLTLWYALPQLKKVKQQKIIKTVSKLLGSSRWVLVGCELSERSIFNLSLCIYFFFFWWGIVIRFCWRCWLS